MNILGIDFKHENNSSLSLGGLAITTDSTRLQEAGTSGLTVQPKKLRGIVYPRSVEEISTLLREANRDGVLVYPISRGKNWGYGGSAPVTDGCVLIDLSRMNRIIDLDTRLATVEIEPGVTQGQLYAALKGTDLMMDVTGAGPETSIVGNVLDRGFGHTPLGMRSQHFVVTELVLADGSIVNLADGTTAASITRVGSSAGLHELLQQSNFALVTRMRVALMHRPESCLHCILTIENDSQVADYIEAMGQLKEEGVFDGLPHMGNDMRALSMYTKFDFSYWDPGKGIPERDLRTLRRQYGIASWTLACGIYGTKQIARAKAKRARQVLCKIGKFRVLSGPSVLRIARYAQAMSRVMNRFSGSLDAGKFERLKSQIEILRLLEGYPTGIALRGCYWRNRTCSWQPDADPIADGCGFRWLTPVLPMKGEVVVEMIQLARTFYQKEGFEFAATLTVVSPRTCQAILSIYFDAENSVERERARRLSHELRKQFSSNGWTAYRLATDEMAHELTNVDPGLIALRSRIKKALDPNGILSPGRYDKVDESLTPPPTTLTSSLPEEIGMMSNKGDK